MNPVERTVGRRPRGDSEARTLTIARVYDTTPDDLWDCCTNPERLARWFLPVSGELRVGGRFSLEGNASGTIEQCEPPHRLDATWEHGGQVSWIELRLTEEGAGRTRLALEHIAHVDDALWDQFGPGAVGVGWDGALLGLTRHLETGAPVDPEAMMAWQASDEGRAFLTASSDAWCEASIAAGTDAAAARAAAARTTDFYTGVAS
jgi:uncharacterized protein YndB with AHSA1/START domain